MKGKRTGAGLQLAMIDGGNFHILVMDPEPELHSHELNNPEQCEIEKDI